MAIFNFVNDGSTFSLFIGSESYGPWGKVNRADNPHSLQSGDSKFTFSLVNPYLSNSIRSTDTVQIGGVALTGTLREKVEQVKSEVIFNAAASGGGSVSIPATTYPTNAAAVATLGAGALYKSTTLINDSPIILITV